MDIYISLSDTWLIDMDVPESQLQWQELIHSRPMTPRFRGGLVSIGDKLWVGGGSSVNESLSNHSLKYNMVDGNDTWLGEVNVTGLQVNWTQVMIRC